MPKTSFKVSFYPVEGDTLYMGKVADQGLQHRTVGNVPIGCCRTITLVLMAACTCPRIISLLCDYGFNDGQIYYL